MSRKVKRLILDAIFEETLLIIGSHDMKIIW
jgi:hypothetical protein